MPAGAAEQAVQRSARPDAYGPQEAAAGDLVAKFWAGPTTRCRSPPAPQPLSCNWPGWPG